MARVWIITGASSGLGLQLAKTAAAAGDTVVAASRNPHKLSDLVTTTSNIHPMHLDPNEALEQTKHDIDAMVRLHCGGDRTIILVNNAGYVQTGTLEETTPETTQRQLQANLLGPLNVYRAVLPHMRSRRKGMLVSIGSMNAWVSLPGCNLYNMSKAAMRAMALGIADEVRPFGIRHCLVEPGAFRTSLLDPQASNFSSSSSSYSPAAVAATGAEGTMAARQLSLLHEDYEQMNADTDALFRGMDGRQPGDPAKACRIIYDVVVAGSRGEGQMPEFLPLGSDAVETIRQAAGKVLAQVDEWEGVARSSDY